MLFFINTFGYVNGHGVFKAFSLLKGTRFRTVGYINLRLTNTAPAKAKSLAPIGESIPKEIQLKAEKHLDCFVQALSAGKKMIEGIGPHLLVGILIRRILRDAIKNNYQNMRVDMEKCSACMRCVKQCPVSCITYANGVFEFSSACEACMRCLNLCPNMAISNQ